MTSQCAGTRDVIRRLGFALASARVRAHDLDGVLACDVDRSSEIASIVLDLDRARSLAWRLADEGTRDLGRARYPDVALSLDLTIDIFRAHELDNALGVAFGIAVDRARALGLDEAIDRARSLDLDSALGSADALIKEISRDLYRAVPVMSLAERIGRWRNPKEITPLAGRLTALAATLLPPDERDRYEQEFRSELWDHARVGESRRRQIGYALRQLRSALFLRAELIAPSSRRASP